MYSSKLSKYSSVNRILKYFRAVGSKLAEQVARGITLLLHMYFSTLSVEGCEMVASCFCSLVGVAVVVVVEVLVVESFLGFFGATFTRVNQTGIKRRCTQRNVLARRWIRCFFVNYLLQCSTRRVRVPLILQLFIMVQSTWYSHPRKYGKGSRQW